MRLFLVAAIFFVGSSLAAPRPQALQQDDALWAQFLQWANQQPPGVSLAVLLPYYGEHLKTAGGSSVPADDAIARLKHLVATRKDEVTAFNFDRIYGGETDLFQPVPNKFLREVAPSLKPGTALDVGAGQGRNSLYLARLGWEVTAFDISPVGLRVAREEARKSQVEITTVVASHHDFDYGTEKWDLIVLAYSWAPTQDPDYVRRLLTSLRPGGRILVEDSPGSLRGKKGSGNPLLDRFADWRVLRHEVTQGVCEWGNPKSPVFRLLAQKPK